MTREETKKGGSSAFDIILITGDAYVDHPSYGTAIIGRILEQNGFSVGIIAQPDWKHTTDFEKLGQPRLFFGITAGNMDSMVSNYNAHKRLRKNDDYSPGGEAGHRPDRATIVYANRIRETFGNIPIVLGGIEASLRRLAHFDWWDNKVRRSILLDSRADILVYGMGEKQVTEIARRLSQGKNLRGIKGTVIISDVQDRQKDLDSGLNFIEIPSFEETRDNPDKFNEALRIFYANNDPFRGRTILQQHANRYVFQYPPPLPLTSKELDGIYELPFEYNWHPSYKKSGGVPGFETVKFSLISHRGCPGQCSFCALTAHQGRMVQSRSPESLIREAFKLTKQNNFKGTIADIGGPTANLYGSYCNRWQKDGACADRSCLIPDKCLNLDLGYKKSIQLYGAIENLPGVKHLFIESGLRYDLLIDNGCLDYFEYICRHNISGRMKVAPEHTENKVLKLMNKPAFRQYEQFAEQYKKINNKIGKDQYLVHYFISGHPGATLEDALHLSLALKQKGIYPEQIQDFIPLPLTISGAMYHTCKHPLTGENVYTAKTTVERKMHRALIQYRHPQNRRTLIEALKILKREDLIPQFLHRKRN